MNSEVRNQRFDKLSTGKFRMDVSHIRLYDKSRRMHQFSKSLFWDVAAESLDVEQHARFIIGRVINRGKWCDWLALKDLYPWDRLHDEVTKIRDLTPKAHSFCVAVFEIPKESFRCTKFPKF